MIVLKTMIVAILVILGLAFGSFINALVWRVYKQEEFEDNRSNIVDRDKKQSSVKTRTSKYNIQSTKYSVLKGRSMCPQCEHELSAKDLIPIFSWLTLKGKCRYCHKPISWQYPLVELLTATLFVVSYVSWPVRLPATSYQLLAFLTWLVILVGLIALAMYDIKWMILPDKIMYPLIIIAAGSLLLQLALGRPLSDVAGVALAAAIGGGIFWLLYQISGGKWIGGGDVKLGFLLGLVVGKPELAFLTLFLASVIGMLYVLPFLLTKKLKATSKVPFGPFLISAGIIVVLFGDQLIDQYQKLLGL